LCPGTRWNTKHSWQCTLYRTFNLKTLVYCVRVRWSDHGRHGMPWSYYWEILPWPWSDPQILSTLQPINHAIWLKCKRLIRSLSTSRNKFLTPTSKLAYTDTSQYPIYRP
jgi:hypothetical protein